MSSCCGESDPVKLAEDLQHQYHRTTKCGVAPGRLAPELVILHDGPESESILDQDGSIYEDLAASGGGGVGPRDILQGFNYAMKFPAMSAEEKARRTWRPSAETEILAVLAPPFNAHAIKYYAAPDEDRPKTPYTSDHHFARRTPEPGDGGDDIIRQALSHCQGCYDKGYHRPDVEIKCTAFGVPEPPYPDHVPEEWIESSRKWLAGGSPSPSPRAEEDDGESDNEGEGKDVVASSGKDA